MTISRPGRSNRARANTRKMNAVYKDTWEDRLPRADKPKLYKKLGLPLILLPFVLMFCGGCVATAPATSLVIALLAGITLMGDIAIKARVRTSYWVVYQSKPVWLVGETKEEAVNRRKDAKQNIVDYSYRYPDDYAGRIQVLMPITEPYPSWAGELNSCEQMELTSSDVEKCWRRESKVVEGVLTNASVYDRLGALADSALSSFSSSVVLSAALEVDSKDSSESECIALIQSLRRELEPVRTHTGTGLYAVKKTPTNETEAQSGAVAGQVVTIAGTLAASPAFTGGYVTNSTQAETRAIVSHDTTTVTLEGDISGWGNEDVLEFYDSWSTVSGAVAQLYTDQSTAAFTADQIISMYDGTYTESIARSGFVPTAEFMLIFEAAAGETSVVLSNSGTGYYAIYCANANSTVWRDFSLTCAVSGVWTIVANRGSEVDNLTLTGSYHGFWCLAGQNTLWIHDSTFSNSGNGTMKAALIENCTFTGCIFAIRVEFTGTAAVHNPCVVSGNVFDGCTNIWYLAYADSAPFSRNSLAVTFINNTCYNGTAAFIVPAGDNAVRFCSFNNIFHTYATVYDYSAATGAFLDSVTADRNTYYNCTNVAELGSSTYNLSEWQALTDSFSRSPDASSTTTDPDLGNPGSDDWSLDSTSDCLHAGIGAYVVCPVGRNAVAFDRYHPDKGAWSSGVGPNVAYAG